MEKPSTRELLIAAVILLLVVPVGFCALFTDARSFQSAEQCVRQMSRGILDEVAKLPDNAALARTGARVEHQLYGNEGQVRRLAQAFEEKGWNASVEPMDEIGWGLLISENPAHFRTIARERVHQLCSVAGLNNVHYRTWRIVGETNYVSQL